MNLRDEWAGLAAAADDAVAAGREFLQAVGATDREDFYGVQSSLILPVVRGVIEGISAFLQAHENQLGTTAGELRRIIDAHFAKIGDGGFPATQSLLPLLLFAKSTVSRLLSDTDILWVPVVERAFAHLQRTLVVDPSARAAWSSAFSEGETSCEKLGGVHLLGHGIFAFKADAAGARTDLVLGTPLSEDDEARRMDAPLVLTEWKVAEDEPEAVKKVQRADVQLQAYASGALLGTELHRTRYVVVVTKSQVALPPDSTAGDAAIRRINIAIEPRTPSKR